MSDGDAGQGANVAGGIPTWLKVAGAIVAWILTFVAGLVASDFLPNYYKTWRVFLSENPEYYYGDDRKSIENSTQALVVSVPTDWSREYPDIERLTIGPPDSANLANVGPAVGIYNVDTDSWWSTWGEGSGLYFGASKALLSVTHDEINDGVVTEEEVASEVETPTDEASDREIINNISGTLGTRCKEQPMRPRQRPNQDYTINRITWTDCTDSSGTPTNRGYTWFTVRPANRETVRGTDQDFVALGLISLVHKGDWIAQEEILDSFVVYPEQIPEP